jgi:hypothetical protein
MAEVSIPNVPLSATDVVVCLLAIVLAGSLTYLVRAVCGMCGRRS